jgi:erythromycin esterase
MGGNLIWPARAAYSQRKIIVWAASSHLARPILPSWVEEYDLKTRMGFEVWKALGEETYTVGFTAAEGHWSRWFDNKPRPLPPPAAGSLEDLFVRAGYSNAFLDFRGRGPDGAWLEQKLTARPFGYVNHETDWTEMFDGIVFTKNMYASTRCAEN